MIGIRIRKKHRFRATIENAKAPARSTVFWIRVSVKDGPENLGVILKKERCKQAHERYKEPSCIPFLEKGFRHM